MKKYLIVLLFFTLLLPFKVFANDIFTYSIKDNHIEFKSDDLMFKNIKLIDNTKNSSLSFGLTGTIINNNDSEKVYETKVVFYDSSSNILAKSTVTHKAKPGEGVFDHTLNVSELKGKKVSDIDYFNIEVNADIKDNVHNNTPSTLQQYSKRDYVIDKYEVIINVNEDNSFDITENIETYYNVQKHGIIRKIPTRNKVTRLDKTTYINKAKITDVKVDAPFKTSTSSSEYSIKIGDAYTYLTGKQNYQISYKYHLGDDNTNKYDELYFNIIGNSWDTVIGNISFVINMPKNFDSTKLGFSRGEYGSTTNNGILYTINGNTITGNYNGVLGVGEGLTVRCELEDGYFVIPKDINWSLIVIILSFVIALIIWFIYGRNSIVIDTVEFYPPDNLNSLEIGRIYKGKANKKDVVSLLIYLASKGYIKIVETREKLIFSSYSTFKIFKIKEYDGTDEQEMKFFNSLFFYASDKEIIDGVSCEYVTTSDLRYNFYRTINKIIAMVNTKENKNKLFEKNSLIKGIMILLFVASLIATYKLITNNLEGSGSLLPLAIILFYIPFFIAIFKINGNVTKIVPFIFVFFHMFIMLYGFTFAGNFYLDTKQTIYIIIGILSIIGIGILIFQMKKRTDYGLKMLGRIKGFKNFLETAEKEKLEEMVEKNPSYFYDILPYTYVLGISNKWIKKFEDIAIPEPDWYTGPNTFNMTSFNRSFDNIMNSTSSAMTSTETSSSSGGWSSGGSSSGGSSGSSGGGSSGGGSGGGGGSSW